MKKSALIACSVAIVLHAQVFELGQVEVVSSVEGLQKSDTNVVVIGTQKMQKDEIKRLSEVAYSTAGVYVDKKGPRAEQNFYIRGFDARRVPLFIDGIPVYIPYDGNADFGRFTTFDLSQIVISKGASSVLYGANTMGGAINLVSKKPTREFEGNIGYGIELGKSKDTFGNNVDFNLGSRQEMFYVQAGGSFMEDRGQQLSSGFVKDINGNEDGGRRENSVQRDKKFNIKFGFTPNETDEYAIAYINQKGAKEQPFYAGRYKGYNQAKRYWGWPKWDKEGVYFLSHTQISDSLYIKSKLFYDSFNNSLKIYGDKAMSKHDAKNAPSYYDDHSYGGGLELGWDMSDKNSLKFATGYKYDVHKEKNDIYNDAGVKIGEEPWQKSADKTYSFGIENTYKFTDMTRLILGASYDTRDAVSAQDYIVLRKQGGRDVYGIYDFEVGKRHAFNYQAALKHSFDGSDELSLSFAKKTYFASMKERYSKRFNRNEPNPYLKPEVANHYEIGYQRSFGENLRLESAVFYSKVKDAIGEHEVTVGANKLKQAINIDKAEYKGFELGANYFATDIFELGGNYTYISAKYKDRSDKIEDLPRHKAFAYVDFKILPKFSLYLSQYMSSSFYSKSQEITKMGGFGVTNFKFTYKPTENLMIDAGISNLFDKNYEYREGFPEEGRVFFSNIRYKF
ncbi:TonB-dependent siderophore receptor [Campylobacter sp. RM16188]|uniref:TonB-dependent receptor plug domain-containing protein n=1 Tax=Campylobacter sp. RM16188 TaxID=1705725 RepID=UPI001556C9D8|nr:TonB-dependent receptor [Campylobacter sp. RM16188]